MKLPVLGPASFERLLRYLLSERGMDVDDAMDWIEGHYDVQEACATTASGTKS